ncbi:hypothetical protein ACFVXV_40150, partial [Streptomyces sp. NPDC058272]
GVSSLGIGRGERLVRAAREARNAAKLRDHPRIVAVHDVVAEDDIRTVVCGRTRMPFVRFSHGGLVINAGSIGASAPASPTRARRKQSAYSVISG